MSLNESASGDTDAIDPAAVAVTRRAVAGKLASAAFGEIVDLLSRSAGYANYKLADLDWLVRPAILNRQFSLVQLQDGPQGASSPRAVIIVGRCLRRHPGADHGGPGRAVAALRRRPQIR